MVTKFCGRQMELSRCHLANEFSMIWRIDPPGSSEDLKTRTEEKYGSGCDAGEIIEDSFLMKS